MEEDNENSPLLQKISSLFHKLENFMAVILSFLLALVLVVIIIRLVVTAYILIFSKVATPWLIMHEDFNDIFGKIITLLITAEFMNSIVGILKGGGLKRLVNDVILITTLAIGRKLILLDYIHSEPVLIVAIGFILISLGVLYYLVNGRIIGKIFPARKNK